MHVVTHQVRLLTSRGHGIPHAEPLPLLAGSGRGYPVPGSQIAERKRNNDAVNPAIFLTSFPPSESLEQATVISVTTVSINWSPRAWGHHANFGALFWRVDLEVLPIFWLVTACEALARNEKSPKRKSNTPKKQTGPKQAQYTQHTESPLRTIAIQVSTSRTRCYTAVLAV